MIGLSRHATPPEMAMPSDPALPGCALLQQDESRAGVLSGLLRGWLGPDAELLESTAVLCRYAPGRRCNFRIALTFVPAPGAMAERRQIVAKVYAKDHGAHAFEMLQELRSHGFSEGRCRVPEPLAYDPRWRLLLLSYAEGDILRSLVLDGRDPSGRMEEAAHWLRAFHQCGVTKGRTFTWRSHLETLASERQAMAKVAPESDHQVEQLLRRFEERGEALSGWAPGPTHRDFSPDHLVIDDQRLTAIDFDECRQYDPMFDVAHFSAHLRLLAFRHGGDATRFDGLVEIFQAAYRAGARDFSEARVRFYQAVAYFKLAHILAVVVRPPAWKQGTEEFLREADRMLEQRS
jgi:aminoglycoside phosphotransferase (APT) family kinase protein